MPRKNKNQAKKKSSSGAISTGKPAKPTPQRPMNPSRRVHVHLSPCVAKYAVSLVDAGAGVGACVPTDPTGLSRKLSEVYVKGSFVIGTNNVGFIAVSPPNAVVSNSASGCVKTSGATYAGTTIDLSVATTGVQTLQSNSDVLLAQIGTSSALNQYKVVSSRVSARYAGAELTRKGRIVALHDPDHSSLQGRDIASISQDQQAKRFAVVREWVNVRYRPVTKGETNFTGTFPTFTPANTDNSYYMGMLVSGATAGEEYEFEFYAEYELEGPAIRGQTLSEADASGFQSVMVSALNCDLFEPNLGDPRSFQAPFLREVARQMKDSQSFVSLAPAGPYSAAGFGNKVLDGTKDVVDIVSKGGSIIDTIINMLDWLF